MLNLAILPFKLQYNTRKQKQKAKLCVGMFLWLVETE